MDFKIKSDFKPTGDQPEAIKSIVDSINRNEKFSTLVPDMYYYIIPL